MIVWLASHWRVLSVLSLWLALALAVILPELLRGVARPAASHAASVRVLVFTKTAGFRHDSIPDAVAALEQLGAQHGFAVDATEDATRFSEPRLAPYDAVVFLLTTGDVLDTAQQEAFERYIGAGGGYVGIHSASDTEHEWLWYGGLVGAYFKDHPPGTNVASLRREIADHPSTEMLPDVWTRRDEWYNFQSNPRGTATVLLSIDTSSYVTGTMGTDHPIAWYRPYEGGRAWYTGGGHTRASYAEPLFLAHILGGIRYAAGMAPAQPPTPTPTNDPSPTTTLSPTGTAPSATASATATPTEVHRPALPPKVWLPSLLIPDQNRSSER